VGFGHLYVDADPEAVAAGIARHLAGRGFARAVMTPERHPRRMKQIREDRTRLYWISPRLGRWTGVFEFRYYSNEARERWGYTDEALARALSRELGEAWRMEVLDGAGFWLWARYVGGRETEGGAYQDTPGERSTDPAHPRYTLNRIIEREGFRNVGLAYEHIPGPFVAPIENVPQSAQGIEGYEGFLHLAFEREEAPGGSASSEAGR
jgi:hypothetical protein